MKNQRLMEWNWERNSILRDAPAEAAEFLGEAVVVEAMKRWEQSWD